MSVTHAICHVQRPVTCTLAIYIYIYVSSTARLTEIVYVYERAVIDQIKSDGRFLETAKTARLVKSHIVSDDCGASSC